MRSVLCLCLLCSLLLLPACTNTQKGIVGGGAVGAATGLGIAAISGGYLGYGALAGAGAGALAGAIMGHNQDVQEEEQRAQYHRSQYHKSQYNRNRSTKHRYEDDDYYEYEE